MRQFSIIAVLCSLITPASADDDRQAVPVAGAVDRSGVTQEVVWNQPFSLPPESSPENGLVLLVVTNDQPWPASVPPANAAPTRFWCQGVLDAAIASLISERDSRAMSIRLESIMAGIPLELTGGKPFQPQSRALVAICDHQYRLLSFVVGVPDRDELKTMVADATEASAWVRAAKDDPQTVIDRLADRNRSRLGRLYQQALTQRLSSVRSDGDDENHADPEILRQQIRLASQDIEPTYLLDVQRRFGFTEAADQVRLRVLEQHVETRRGWCEVMLPFVAGANLVDVWQPLTESIWGYPPITGDMIDATLPTWVRSQLDSGPVVLMVRPPMDYEHLMWPPTIDPHRSRGKTWRDVHARALEHPFRTVSLAEVANLIRHFDLQPIQAVGSSLVRYLYWRPDQRELFVVRETDPPSRFDGILKRSKSNLVKK